MGKVPFRPKCRICGKGTSKGKYPVKNVWDELIQKCGAICAIDGTPYDKEADLLCGGCKIAIKPVGKSLKHPKQLKELQNVAVTNDASTSTDDLDIQEPIIEQASEGFQGDEFPDENELQFDDLVSIF